MSAFKTQYFSFKTRSTVMLTTEAVSTNTAQVPLYNLVKPSTCQDQSPRPVTFTPSEHQTLLVARDTDEQSTIPALKWFRSRRS